METTVNQRIEQFLKARNIPQTEIAAKLNVTKQTVSNWVSGTVQIPVKHIVSLLKEYDYLNARWLLTGTGELDNDAVNEVPASLKMEGMIDLLSKQLADKDKVIASLQKEVGKLEERIASRKK
jgi:transcriptional regulator with XRE-family HTH domain